MGSTFRIDSDTPIEVYKFILEQHIERPFEFPENLLDQLHDNLIKEVWTDDDDTLGKKEFIEDSLLALEDAKRQNRKGDANLDFIWPLSRGRLYAGVPTYRSVTPVNEDLYDRNLIDAVENGLADFGTRSNKFCSSVWGKRYNLPRQYSALSSKFGSENLLSRGYQSNDGIKIGDEIKYDLDAGSYIWADPVVCRLYLHRPSSIDRVNVWKFEKVDCHCPNKSFRVTRLVPDEVIVICPSEVEFTITKGFAVDTWAKWLSLGINCALDQSKTQTYTSQQATVKVTLHGDFMKPRGKKTIDISKAKAEKFLKEEADLRAFKLQLDYKEEVKALTDEREREVEDLQHEYATSTDAEAFASMVNLIEQTNEEVDAISKQIEKGNSNCFIFKISGPNICRTYIASLNEGFLEFQLIENNALNGAQVSSIINKRFKILDGNANFNQLRADTGKFNDVAGYAFEDIMNARIMEAASKKGVPLKLIEGDGIGRLPLNGRNVPDYVDAVFINVKTGDHTGVQYKYSNEAWKLTKMTKKHHDHHGNKKFQGIPSLDGDKVQMVGPRDAAKTAKGIKGEVNIDGELNVKAPTNAEIEEHIQRNYDKFSGNNLQDVKKIQNSIKNWEKTSSSLKKQLKSMRKKLANQMKALQNAPKAKKAALQQKVQEKQKSLNKINQKIDEIDNTHIKDAKKELADVEQNLATKGPSMTKQVAKFVGKAALIGAVIDAAVTLAMSLDTEIRKYREGKITGSELAVNVLQTTSLAFLKGGAIGGGFALAQIGTQAAANSSYIVVSILGKVASKVLGPTIILASLGYQAYNVLKLYNDASITKAEMQRQMIRAGGITAAGVGGFALATAVCSTGVGAIALGSAICIAAVVGDYFGGDALLKKLGLTDDPKEQKAIHDRHVKEFEEEVLDHAYELFDLEKNCSNEELKEAYKVALLKYHPDKSGGDESLKFQAVFAAYTLIKHHRGL